MSHSYYFKPQLRKGRHGGWPHFDSTWFETVWTCSSRTTSHGRGEGAAPQAMGGGNSTTSHRGHSAKGEQSGGGGISRPPSGQCKSQSFSYSCILQSILGGHPALEEEDGGTNPMALSLYCTLACDSVRYFTCSTRVSLRGMHPAEANESLMA